MKSIIVTIVLCITTTSISANILKNKTPLKKIIKNFADAPTNLIIKLIQKKLINKKTTIRQSAQLAAVISGIITVIFGLTTHAVGEKALSFLNSSSQPLSNIKNLILFSLYGTGTVLMGIITIIVGASCSSHIRKAISKKK